MTFQIEESGAETTLCYSEPTQDTLLHAIQSDMLVLRNPTLDPLTTICQVDDTIQVHIASSPLREVQIPSP